MTNILGPYLPLVIFGVFFTVFLIIYTITPHRLINGFNLVISLLALAAFLFYYLSTHPNLVFSALWVLLILLFLIVLLLGTVIILAFLLINSFSMFRKESRTLANSLSFVLALLILIQINVGAFFAQGFSNKYFLAFLSFLHSIEIYLVIVVISFILMTIIILLDKPKKTFLA